MMTFVLVLFLTSGSATQISGYSTRDECIAAGKSVVADPTPTGTLVQWYTCVPGPRRD